MYATEKPPVDQIEFEEANEEINGVKELAQTVDAETLRKRKRIT